MKKTFMVIILTVILTILTTTVCVSYYYKTITKNYEKDKLVINQANRELTEIEKQVFTERIDILNKHFFSHFPINNINSISNQAMLVYGVNEISEGVLAEQVESNIKKVLGNNINIVHEDILCSIDNYPIYIYDKDVQSYQYNEQYVHGHGNPHALAHTKFYYVSTNIKDEKEITINAHILYGTVCSDVCGPSNSYYIDSNHSGEPIIAGDSDEHVEITDELYQSIKDKIPITTYKFEKDSFGSYTLKSITINE